MRHLNLWSIIPILALAACASAPPQAPPQPPKPKHDAALKPTSSAHAALTTYLDSITKGGSLGFNWCADHAIMATEFFAPTRYEILSQPDRELRYSDAVGAYWSVHTVRLWSSNKGGSPIVKDWSISLGWSEKKYAQAGTLSWCIRIVS